jgi:single-strand DNA-binding protein
MASFNKVILIGNMAADPELKQTTSGISVCSFSIAVNRKFAKEGEQSCDFITIQTWRQTAEFVTRYFKKGKPILVCGQLQVRTWTDSQGNKRYATEVVADEVSFVDKSESSTEAKPQPSTYTPSAYGATNAPQFEEIPNDGDFPF